ncbi:interleukin-17C-like isoform X1 [Perca fluviatilis]|uniref:interleukin-17C-like isoform X1 n=1 Tax=Perca fluviatilis TaxID=8168 RepID=UPI0019666546|nr:interleukin-17C-like isoform X1 [Perca fluviatilis]
MYMKQVSDTRRDRTAAATGCSLLCSLHHFSCLLTFCPPHPQILIFGLLLVPVWTKCYEDDRELQKAAEKLMNRYPQPAEPPATAAPDSPASCPVEHFPQQSPQHLHDRSLSPWRYVLVTKKDHFPSTYAEAQCLCSGCVLIQNKSPPMESHDYNSHPVTQSRVFLKKEPCDSGKKYHLKPVTVKVAVGCTCVRANRSS